MYYQWLATVLIASAPLMAAPQTATQKPTTQKPATSAPATPAAGQKAGADAAKGVRTIDIVGTDDMKFSLATIQAKPGEQIRVRLTAKGAMPKIAMAHNFVLLALKADVIKFVNASATARATDFVPPDSKDTVIAHTALAGAGETVEVTFKVPTVAGNYTYLCSFPGHFQAGMKGTLTVK